MFTMCYTIAAITIVIELYPVNASLSWLSFMYLYFSENSHSLHSSVGWSFKDAY